MSEEYAEGDWVSWECRNGVEIAARRTTTRDNDITWMCGNWLWYAGGRHTVAGIDHPFDLVRPLYRLVPDGAAGQYERVQQELHETHQECGRAQRLLEEEREKSARYAGELHDLDVRWRSRELALFQVIEMLVARRCK